MESSNTKLIEAARELAPRLQDYALHIDRERRLPDDVITFLRERGFFRMLVPREYGGDEVDPWQIFEALELLAAADASTAWVAGVIGTAPAFLLPFADRDTMAALYGSSTGPDTAIAGSAVPKGTAYRVQGGYRLSGRWPMVSGSQFADWYILSFIVVGEQGPILDAANMPQVRSAIVPAASAEVIDTWFTTGLRGTASNDVAVHDLLVEEAWTLALDPRHGHILPESPVANPLYSFITLPFTIAIAVPLGIFRRAIDVFIDIARAKKVGPTMAPLCETGAAQRLVGMAEASLQSSRLYLLESTRAMVRALEAKREPTPAERAGFRLSIAHAMRSARDGVTQLYQGVGSTAIYANNQFDRLLRDVQTISTHYAASESCFDNCGRVFLGMPPVEPFF